jgi:hypothetical protein
LGYSDRPEQFKRFIERNKSLFIAIEQLCPSVGTEATGGSSNGPNVEYPWWGRDKSQNEVWHVPSEHVFPIAADLRSRDGIRIIVLIRDLLDRVPGAIM